MSLFWTQVEKELREQWATRKALVVLVVMLAFGFLAPITAKVLPDLIGSLGQGQGVTIILPEPTMKDSLMQYVKNTDQVIAFVAMLLAFLAVVSERERGQMTLVFPHGLPRRTFVLAKFVALAALLAVGLVIEAAAVYLYTTLLFTAPDPATFVVVTLLLYVYLLLLVALALLASTLAQTMIAAAAITFTFFVLVMVSGLFTTLAPHKVVEWATALVAGVSAASPWEALASTLALTVFAVVASCVTLSRQEISSAIGT